MAKLNHTHIHFILDRSGSMGAMKVQAIEGYNEFITGQADAPGTADLTFVQFDHEYQTVLENTDIKLVKKLDDQTYVPRGTTALLDAIGISIDRLGEDLAAKSENERPELVMMVILTDGMENSSSSYNLDDIKNRIEHQQSHYNWQFEFLSSDLNSIKLARNISIPMDNIVKFENSEKGMKSAFHNMNETIFFRRGSLDTTQEALKNSK